MRESDKPFGAALGDLLVESEYTTEAGRPNWSAFAADLEDVHYETLRRAVTGSRRPSPRLLQECARALRVRAEYFLEYRAYLAQREFDPLQVGAERAARNLRAWDRVR